MLLPSFILLERLKIIFMQLVNYTISLCKMA